MPTKAGKRARTGAGENGAAHLVLRLAPLRGASSASRRRGRSRELSADARKLAKVMAQLHTGNCTRVDLTGPLRAGKVEELNTTLLPDTLPLPRPLGRC